MHETSSQRRLRARIIEHSRAPIWDNAKREWRLERIHRDEDQCACGHAIAQNCVIQNIHNGEVLVVGSCCINHFNLNGVRDLPQTFASLEKLSRNPHNTTASDHLLDLAVRLGVIIDFHRKEYQGFTKGRGSRSLSPNNKNHSCWYRRAVINDKIVKFFTRQH